VRAEVKRVKRERSEVTVGKKRLLMFGIKVKEEKGWRTGKWRKISLYDDV
jgi:hypothetical protein